MHNGLLWMHLEIESTERNNASPYSHAYEYLWHNTMDNYYGCIWRLNETMLLHIAIHNMNAKDGLV